MPSISTTLPTLMLMQRPTGHSSLPNALDGLAQSNVVGLKLVETYCDHKCACFQTPHEHFARHG